MTRSGGRAERSSTNAVRAALGSAVVGLVAAAAVVLAATPTASTAAGPVVPAAQFAPVAPVAPVAPGAVGPADPVTAAATTSPKAAPATTRSRASAPRTTSTRSRSTSAGCGQDAVTAGRFDPSCSEYQGYLDPGRAGGRAPSSGDLQTDYGCEQGYIPASECD